MAGFLTGFLSGFVGQTNDILAERAKRQAELDDYRAKKADDLKNWFTMNEFKQGLDKDMASYNSDLHMNEQGNQADLDKSIRSFQSNLDINRDTNKQTLENQGKLDELKSKQDFEREQTGNIRDMITGVTGGPIQGGLGTTSPDNTTGKTPTANLYRAKALAEAVQADNPSAKAAADSINTLITANDKLNVAQDKATEFPGGDPYKGLNDVLKSAKQDRPFSASIFFPKTDKVKVSDDRHRDALVDTQNLINALGDQTRITNDATGVDTNNSRLTAGNVVNIAVNIAKEKQTILSPTATPDQKYEAVSKIDDILKTNAITPDKILANPKYSAVFTPDFNKVYNQIAKPVSTADTPSAPTAPSTSATATPVSGVTPTVNTPTVSPAANASKYTPEALQFTAAKYGMTVDEVKKKLGIQ